MSPSVTGSSSSTIINTDVANSSALVNASADASLPQAQGDSMFSNGIHTLFNNMNMLSEQANDKYKMLEEKAQFARDAHDMANQVEDAIGATIGSGSDTTAEVPENVKTFMQNKQILVHDMSIDDYIKKYGPKLSKSQLTAVKNALQTESDRASDFVSQSQLELQGLLQKYNVTVSLINSMQTLLSEMNKSIAQNIR